MISFISDVRIPESVTFRKYIVVKKTETDIVTIEVVSLATLLNGFQTKVIPATLLMLISATPSLSLFSFLKINSTSKTEEKVTCIVKTQYRSYVM